MAVQVLLHVEPEGQLWVGGVVMKERWDEKLEEWIGRMEMSYKGVRGREDSEEGRVGSAQFVEQQLLKNRF